MMPEILPNGKGYWGRILWVDLSAGKTAVEELDDAFYQKFLSGVGLGAKVLWDRLPAGADPLGPENILGFTTGLLTDGVKRAAEKLGRGSEQFAVHCGGVETPMHDPKFDPGFGTAYACEPAPGRHTVSSYTWFLPGPGLGSGDRQTQPGTSDSIRPRRSRRRPLSAGVIREGPRTHWR